MLFVGYLMVIIVLSKNLSSFHYFLDISYEVHLLLDTNQRGYYDNLVMFSLFLHFLLVGEFCSFPGQCAIGYMKWFYRISHLFMSLPQLGEPLKHPPMVHDDTYIIPNPPVLPVHSTTMPQLLHLQLLM